MSVDPRILELLERWESLYHQGKAVTPDELCAECPELLDEVQRRIADLRALHGRFSTGAEAGASSAVPWPDAGAAGLTLAPVPAGSPQVPGYELLGRLGRGGMGVVYKARHVQLKRVVALKMILAGPPASPAEVARFRTEAEAVARLQHPQIVQIHDIGEHDGLPYFSREFVDGGRLDQQLAGTPQEPRRAAELVRTLAQAMAAAHQKGIIHRDLKPANVLLTADGVPKITDFGLAKKLDEAAGPTASGAIMGTPSYMAPEQARGDGKAIGPVTDVYALGALLYETLTGRPPFKGATAFDTLEQVLHQEPVPPRRLQPKVPLDLDTICLKCLRKEPDKRYASAAALAEDLRRFRGGEPIRARPVHVWERSAKWARRRPAITALLALLLVVVAGGFFGMMGLSLRAETARQGEVAQRERAEEKTRVAEAVQRFLEQDLLLQADPTAQANTLLQAGSGFRVQENPTIKELLDRAAAELAPDKIEAKFPGQPEVQASILKTVGAAYRGIGAFDKAVAFLSRASDTYRGALGADHADTLATLNNLAVAYLNAGQFDKALPLLEQTLATRKEKLGPEHPDTLTSMSNLANAYWNAGQRDKALLLLEQTLAKFREQLGPDHPDTLISMNNLAEAYRDAGQLDKALPLYEQTLAKSKEKKGPDHPDTLISMNNLANACRDAGQLDKALPLYEQTLAKQNEKLGPDHPDTLTTLDNLGGAYWYAGRTAEAIALFEEVRDARVTKLGADHPDTLTTLNNLALAYGAAGRTAEAIALFEQVRDAHVKQLGADHPDTLTSLNNLAVAYLNARRTAEAIALFEQVRDARVTKLGADHPDTLTTLASLAKAYRAAGKLEQALPLFQQAASGIVKRQFRHEHAGPILGDLSACHEQLKQYEPAETWRRKWLAVVKERAGPQSTAYAGELAGLGRNLLLQHKCAEAEATLRECLALRTKQDPDAWTTFDTQSLLGGALLGQQRYADAESLLKAGYEGLKQREATIPPAGKVRLTEALERLVQLYDAWGKPDQANEWRQKLEQAKTPPKTPTK